MPSQQRKLVSHIARTTACLGAALCLGAPLPAIAGNASPGAVRMGVPPWPGVTIKSAVVKAILQPLGYQVKYIKASAPIVYRGLASDQIDINLSAWSPGQAPSFEPYVKKGKVVNLGRNLTGAIAGFAVPDYVYRAGLHNDRQIPKFAAHFHHKIYCIDPGSGANTVVKKGIKKNIYGLKGWTIVPSSTAAMLAEVKHEIRRKQWIMFCAWRPHWMNVILPMKYLKDPKSLWGPHGGHSQVFTLASTDFVQQHPNLARFFRRFQVSSKTQSHWVYQSAYKNRPSKKVADRWIADHLKQVEGWLKGVKARNGKAAPALIAARFNG